MLVLVVHLVFALGDRTTDDERRTCVIDEHRVNLIDDGVVVSALYEVERRGGHVITQVVEAEFVVRTKGDIAGISTTALLAIGFIAVDAVNGQSEEHVNRSVPLAVTLSQVVVDGDYVNAFVREGIEVNGQCGNERLTFTGSHLGYLTLVQYNTTDELNVVVNHVPCNLVSSGSPVVMVQGFVAVYINKVEALVSSEVAVHVVGCDDDVLAFSKAACC